MAWRDVKSRYKQAALGVVWAVVQPLVGTAALIFVFHRLAGLPSEGIPYAAFALAGYAIWTYMSGSVGAVTNSVLTNSALVTKVYFPRLVVPLAAVLPGLLDLSISLVLLGVVMVVTGIAPTGALVLLPACVLLAALVSLAVGLFLATANVKYRDVGHAVGFLLQLWFFATPVAYPMTLVGARWRLLYALNPAAGTVTAFRATLLGGPVRADELLVSLAATVVLLAGGLLCFQRLERRFADVI